MQDERDVVEKHVGHGDVEQQVGDGQRKMQSFKMAGWKDAKKSRMARGEVGRVGQQ